MTDQELIKKLKDPAQNEQAFAFLVKSYKQKVYWKIRQMVIDPDDADDVTQDVFVKIWQNLYQFREDSKLYTWIFRIAVNETLTFLQKKRKRESISIDDNEILENSLEMGIKEGYIDGDEIELKLQKAILQLPDKQRLVFNLKYFDKLSYEEISEITSTTVGGLKATYHVAAKKIEEYFNSL
jgi:RNA polymerase sigma factor (sigma-70 family)